ncbi:MAG: hypothetical protein GKS00_10490 [Alphaproteobacteria bacterium]|nr:hypothetical protein [Alphaproteobacteria bacterium]
MAEPLQDVLRTAELRSDNFKSALAEVVDQPASRFNSSCLKLKDKFIESRDNPGDEVDELAAKLACIFSSNCEDFHCVLSMVAKVDFRRPLAAFIEAEKLCNEIEKLYGYHGVVKSNTELRHAGFHLIRAANFDDPLFVEEQLDEAIVHANKAAKYAVYFKVKKKVGEFRYFVNRFSKVNVKETLPSIIKDTRTINDADEIGAEDLPDIDVGQYAAMSTNLDDILKNCHAAEEELRKKRSKTHTQRRHFGLELSPH